MTDIRDSFGLPQYFKENGKERFLKKYFPKMRLSKLTIGVGVKLLLLF
jgi:hypothetical protein